MMVVSKVQHLSKSGVTRLCEVLSCFVSFLPPPPIPNSTRPPSPIPDEVITFGKMPHFLGHHSLIPDFAIPLPSSVELRNIWRNVYEIRENALSYIWVLGLGKTPSSPSTPGRVVKRVVNGIILSSLPIHRFWVIKQAFIHKYRFCDLQKL